MDIEDFRNKINDGVWVLADASDVMKAYAKKHTETNEQYNEAVRKYQTPQKYIKRGHDIIVVSLSNEIWGGIYVYDLEDMIFQKGYGSISINVLKKKNVCKRIVERADYDNVEYFKTSFIKSGYITEAECNKYFNDRSLPLIKVDLI